MTRLGAPIEVFQLTHPGLAPEHPPLASLDARPNNLPTQLTLFLGRTRELAGIVQVLGRDDVRILTVTGAGGSGKTRLALQAAASLAGHFRDGALFVDLAPLGDPSQLPASVLSALRVVEMGRQRAAADVLKDHLRNLDILLVLDNFEHVVSAATLVTDLVLSCPRVKVLATSREPLRLRAEREYALAPFETEGLEGAESLGDLAGNDAVPLFVDRARAVLPTFDLSPETAPAVAEICARLDGLPLAIELTSALIRVLTPQALLERIRGRVALPRAATRDLPARREAGSHPSLVHPCLHVLATMVR